MECSSLIFTRPYHQYIFVSSPALHLLSKYSHWSHSYFSVPPLRAITAFCPESFGTPVVVAFAFTGAACIATALSRSMFGSPRGCEEGPGSLPVIPGWGIIVEVWAEAMSEGNDSYLGFLSKGSYCWHGSWGNERRRSMIAYTWDSCWWGILLKCELRRWAKEIHDHHWSASGIMLVGDIVEVEAEAMSEGDAWID